MNWENAQFTSSPTPSPEDARTPRPTEVLFPRDDEEKIVEWSSPRSAMGSTVLWKWTLANLETPSPSLIVDITAEGFASDEWVGFGVAEKVMQGALVACSDGMATMSVSRTSLSTSNCVTLFGDGMGITVPEQDPVKPRVLVSSRNETHYTVRFSASLFGCWANPRLPARVLFAKGKVSGDGAPQPHLNNGQNREATAGIKLLSVVQGFDDSGSALPVAAPTPELEPLPAMQLWEPVEGSHAGSVTILDGRVTVEHNLYHHEKTEIISIGLNNVASVSRETYIAFGFAEHVMSGLIMSCAPRMGISDSSLTAKCHQWRGQGTNLLPLNARSDAGGWFLNGIASNGTHLNYTFAGRIHDVTDSQKGDLMLSDGVSSIRAICAVGRSTPDSGTPLIHQVQDRAGFTMELRVAADNYLPASSAPAVTGKGVMVIIPLCVSALFLSL